MKVLLSPAKSIQMDCLVPEIEYSLPVYKKEASSLAKKLKKLKSKDLIDLMHVSEDIAQLNVMRYKNWHLTDIVTEDVKPAAYIFTGEVYKGLDISSLSDESRIKAQENIRMLSGLYGLLRPLDLIYPYRLEMGTRWEITDDVKNLYSFWSKKLTKQLEKETKQNELIFNLASTEYSKAVDLKNIKRTVITPTFKEEKNGDYKVVMIFAKHARGAMARWIIENDVETVETLKNYGVDGYAYNERLSTENAPVFTR